VLEAGGGDRLAADEAPAKFALVDSLQRRFDRLSLGLAAALLGESHRLDLHGVDPRQPADAILIQRDRRAVGFGKALFLLQLGAAGEQTLSEEGGFGHAQRTSSTGTWTVRIIAVVVLPTISVLSGEWP
jgi:hypothetical protein